MNGEISRNGAIRRAYSKDEQVINLRAYGKSNRRVKGYLAVTFLECHLHYEQLRISPSKLASRD